MQQLCIALLIFTALLAPAQQPAATDPASSGKLSIPAQLTKAVRADKAHAGDPVEFRTLEPVLVGKGLVMPANTSLHGRVLGASPKQDGKNSWLALVVERAEWTQHSLPLHAFVAAQISISVTNNQRAADPGMAGNTTANPRRARAGERCRDGALRSKPFEPDQVATRRDRERARTRPRSIPSWRTLASCATRAAQRTWSHRRPTSSFRRACCSCCDNEPGGSPETADAKAANSAPDTGQQN